jgi:hypothetical protein
MAKAQVRAGRGKKANKNCQGNGLENHLHNEVLFLIKNNNK